jgi:chitinase
VVLPTEREKGLLARLVGLKRVDPDLKVLIAIGGWTFNDPGQPTQKIFSDLARSEDNQRKFFKSLISFMSTFDLDGVDLDWEYPGPDEITERGGREEDFKNFPTFMKNLKNALKSTGGRNEISITLPASYWFLQFFDIVELEKHISFFNIMSYVSKPSSFFFLQEKLILIKP